jgi:hypothetical protein
MDRAQSIQDEIKLLDIERNNAMDDYKMELERNQNAFKYALSEQQKIESILTANN